MNRGWVGTYRRLLEHWLWKDKPFAKGQAWIDMIMLANHGPNRLKTRTGFVDLERGSFHTEERTLMERWGWSNSKVRNFLRTLVSEKMISISVKKSITGKSAEGTTIKVLNYEIYQGSMLGEKSSEGSAKKSVEKRREISGASKQECNNEKNNISSEFEKFYAEYPRHEGRAAAVRAWKKVKKSEIAAVMDGVRRYKAKVAGTENRFIKTPAAWLNDRRWEDEVDEEKTGVDMRGYVEC